MSYPTKRTKRPTKRFVPQHKTFNTQAPAKPYKIKGPSPIPTGAEWPMRINKYLAQQGISTRRGADELIEKKLIHINGRVATLGDKINEGDQVDVLKNTKQVPYVYYAFNKPVGVITHSPQSGEKEITDVVPLKGVFPVGRLDKESSGLIILTNDGRLTDRLLNPKYDHDKQYLVTTVKPLRSSFKDKMEKGVNIEGYVTEPCKVEILDDNKFLVTLTEGKKHQIRRMVVSLFNEVETLQRVRIMNILLGKLPAGSWRPIEGEEKETLLASLGL